jgi:hypothetical protein
MIFYIKESIGCAIIQAMRIVYYIDNQQDRAHRISCGSQNSGPHRIMIRAINVLCKIGDGRCR